MKTLARYVSAGLCGCGYEIPNNIDMIFARAAETARIHVPAGVKSIFRPFCPHGVDGRQKLFAGRVSSSGTTKGQPDTSPANLLGNKEFGRWSK